MRAHVWRRVDGLASHLHCNEQYSRSRVPRTDSFPTPFTQCTNNRFTNAPGDPFALEAGMLVNVMPNEINLAAGVAFRNSTTGKVKGIVPKNSQNVVIQEWTNNSNVADSNSQAILPMSPIFFRLVYDGTNTTFSFGARPGAWTLLTRKQLVRSSQPAIIRSASTSSRARIRTSGE